MISIIVPVYNCEKYLRECIESVINQNEEFELILMDGGSTDNSGLICDEYASKYPNIKVFHTLNNGPLASRTNAMAKAKGDYYLCLDGDDYLEPNTLSTLYKNINEYNPDCLIFNFRRVNDNKEVLYNCKSLSEKTVIIEDKAKLLDIALTNKEYDVVWRKLIKKNLVNHIDYSDYYYLRRGEDFLLSLDVYKYASKFVFINDCLYNYRFNSNGLSQVININNYSFDPLTLQKSIDLVNELNCLDDHELSNFYGYLITLLIRELRMISLFKCADNKKIELYKEIYNSSYYNNLKNKHYSNVGSRVLFYKVFKHKHFKLLNNLFKAVNGNHN